MKIKTFNYSKSYQLYFLKFVILSFFITSCASNTSSNYNKTGVDELQTYQYLSQQDIQEFNAIILTQKRNIPLSHIEKQILDIAKGYLQKSLLKNEALPKLIALESPTLKFALDPDQVQLLRETDTDYVRVGFQSFDNNGNISLSILAQESIFVEYDLAKVAPKSTLLVDSLHNNGIPVIAILGKARIGTPERVVQAIKTGTRAMDHLFQNREVAFLTGGYKGALDDVYGYTRIGYDRAKDLGAYTLVVMPEAGDEDSHKYVDAKDIVGKMWGDDTPALAGITDGAVVFAGYGSWTKVEVETLLYLKKPVVIINPAQKDSIAIVNFKFGSVKSFRQPEDAVQALLKSIPNAESLIKNAPNNINQLPIRNNQISAKEYYPFPGWFDIISPKTATSRVSPIVLEKETESIKK